MKRMSFFYTQEQIIERTKTVTRRLGWKKVKPGTLIKAVNKCQGLRNGEKPIIFGTIRILDVRREPLWKINKEDCKKEGFPYTGPSDFIEMFCKSMKCDSNTIVTRIEFEYV
jgi:hypothetical protein